MVLFGLLPASTATRMLAAQQQPSPPDGPDTSATFYGIARVFTGDVAAGLVLEAYIGEASARTLCGRTTVEADGRYIIAVASAVQYPGCGRAGDTVRFSLTSTSSLALGAQASVIYGLPARQTGTFQPGQAVELELRRVAPPSGPAVRFPRAEDVRLPPGCTNVVLTWPGGTAIAEVAGVVRSVFFPDPAPPPLVAIWRHDVALGRFVAWSPLPEAPNDLTEVNELDAVFICVQTAAFLTRPVR
jgi:hypothetical protein